MRPVITIAPILYGKKSCVISADRAVPNGIGNFYYGCLVIRKGETS